MTSTSIVPALITVSGAILVGVLTVFFAPAFTSLRSRRQGVNDRFDAALSALLMVTAARQIPRHFPYLESTTEEEKRVSDQRLYEKGLEFFVETTAAAKASVSLLQDYLPESRTWLTEKWELEEGDVDFIAGEIRLARQRAVKTERLFLQRRLISRRSAGS